MAECIGSSCREMKIEEFTNRLNCDIQFIRDMKFAVKDRVIFGHVEESKKINLDKILREQITLAKELERIV